MSTERDVAAAYRAHQSLRNAASSLDMPVSTFRHYLKKARESGLADGPDGEPSAVGEDEPCGRGDIDFSKGRAWLELTDYTMPTEADILARYNLDPDIWRVTRLIPNQWQGFIKKGAKGDERTEKVTMYALRVHVERQVPEPVENAVKALAQRINPLASPRVDLPARDLETEDPQLCVFGLYDAHIGALAWGGEVDQSNDTPSAVGRCKKAVDELLSVAAEHPIQKMLCPIGNDLMHFDNERGETTSGNVTTDFDTRYAKTVEACFEVLSHFVDRTLEVCDDVHLLYVGGNHDRLASYHLTHWLKQRYANDLRVYVDTSFHLRKYVLWGTTLIGFTHADRMNLKDAYRLMAEEARESWARATCREIHCGHLHHRKNIDQTTTDTLGKVTIRQNPSLTPRDLYSYQHGYEAVRCADLWRYNRYGLKGFETTYAESP